MAGSSIGTLFRITTWGESHGKAIGVVIDGCPAGLPLTAKDIQPFLNRRKPGQSRYTTKRMENDRVEILSGTFEGKTTGTPISLIVQNQDQHSADYSQIASCYRPGHADYGFDAKFGFRDYRGGGRSSGRETIARVAGGAVASLILKELGITFLTYTRAIGPVTIRQVDPDVIEKNPFYMPDASAAEKAAAYLETCMAEKNSCGGVIECRISGVPAGIGDPVFDKLDAALARAVMSIGAIKGVEIGDGFRAASSTGAKNNDSFLPPLESDAKKDGTVPGAENSVPVLRKATNHAGGILGGISDGTEICLRAAVKPTASIAQPQDTVDRTGQPIHLEIHGRHDPVIVPRAVVVVESMAAITLLDSMLIGMTSRLDRIRKFYRNDLPL